MPTFSEQIKEEIVNLNFKDDGLKALLSSFITNNLEIIIKHNESVWEIKSQFSPLIRFLANALERFYTIKRQISYTIINKINNRRTYKLTLKGDFQQIATDLELFQLPKKIINNEYCMKAYLAGAFLSGGSVNSLEKSHYHLEIRSSNVTYLRTLQNILGTYNISISLLKRKYNYFLYIKKSEDISDFLKIIGAYEAMQELEDKRISRDLNNQIHRLNNLDISNIKKASETGSLQVAKIKAISSSKYYVKSSNKFKKYCNIRLEYPDSSLNELVKLLNSKYHIKITKGGLNHYNIKINKIYDLIK